MRRIISSRKKQGQFIAAPVVSGNTSIGSVLSVTDGVFDGPTSTYTYQWFLEGSPISGATANTYTLPDISNGILRCVVKATNSKGSVKSTSNFFTIRNSFNFVIKTDNISTGSSTAAQFKLPLVSTGTYNCTVYWGDGTSDTITTWDQAQTTHTYATTGTYNVYIAGTVTGWTFNNTGDRLKILSIGWWGPLRPGDNTAIFMGCGNLMLDNVRDVLDTTGMTSFFRLLHSCTRLVRVNRINEWNTSSITNMFSVFDGNINFDDNISNWNTSNVTTFELMFVHAAKFNNGGSPDINKWDTSNATSMRFMFGADGTVPGGTYTSFNQPISNWNTSKVTNMSAMFARNTAFNQDIGTKVVTVNGVTYTAWDTLNVTDMSSMFQSAAATGVAVPPSKFNNGGSDSIKNWNTSKVTLMNSMFSGNPVFNYDIGTKVVTVNGVTYTAWDTLNVTSMSFMFNSFLNTADSFGIFNNGGSNSIKNWNTSKVTTLVAFCQRQAFFNQDVGTKVVTVGGNTYTAWNIENVTSLSNAFTSNSSVRAGSFNNGGSDSIKHWNTSKVTTMASLFNCQQSFNQPIGTRVSTINGVTYTAWDTLNVTNMSGMLNAYTTANTLSGVFNSGGSSAIGNWNTSKVTTFAAMFQNQPLFNRDINTTVTTINGVTYTAWDTLNVTNMSNVFGVYRNTGIFNQNIDNWNTSKVTTMQSMFRGQILYDKSVGTKQVTVGASTYTAWDTLNVTDMSSMFNANLLNSDAQGVFNNSSFNSIRNFNTSKVKTFLNMFKNQPLFNQNLRTFSVTIGASTYNAWDTLEATNMSYMFFNKTGNAVSQFNQNIGNWNTAKVTDMTAMFYNAASFNQNLNSWNVSLVTSFNSSTILNETFADGIGLSTTDYDNLLEGWSSRPVLANKVISFGTTKYSAAAAPERAILTSAPNNWTIIDGGQI
jgi:surface protein